MAAGRLVVLLLAAALISIAVCQDGLTCTNVGETWHYLCNTCSCRSGVTVCTRDRCSSHGNPLTSGSCIAGSKWVDGCGHVCLCDPSGKTRCTVAPCPARVSTARSMTFIKTAGDPCAEGDAWSVGCNRCSCADGMAVCTSDACPTRPPAPPEPCEPDERWEDECGNVCHCSEHGAPACTMLTCAAGQRAGSRRRPIRRSGDRCQNEGDRWQQDCNECHCGAGVVSCTHKLCAPLQEPEKYGECQANTRWVDECDNTCHCTDGGVPACTLNECPHGRQEGELTHYMLEDGAPCSNEGEPWQQGCSRCECRAGRVFCAHRGCPESRSVTGGPEPDWMHCVEGTTWEDECGNICGCWEGVPLCTRMGCPKGRVAGKPVKFILFDGDSCPNEGKSWKDDCNTCSCTDGAVSCTKKFCLQQRQSVRFISPLMAMSCTPGARWVDECDNTCFCPTSGHSACTMMACPPGKRPMVPVRYIHSDGDACTDEGASWKHECNTCRCSSGRVTCTKRPCRQMRRPLLRAPQLLSADADPASDKQCEEDTDWTDECDNHCRCASGGLIVCTLKVCAPGKQAGQPLPLRPKLGEQCDQPSSETWLDDCNTCQCVDGSTACTRATCRQREQLVDGVPVQQCRPGSSWLDECDNHCHCSDLGLSYCTLKACPHGLQYGVPKKFVLANNDTCSEEDATWRQDCNTCTCTGGRVNCSQDICDPNGGIGARFSFTGLRCVPRSKWTDQCENTCRCTADGQPACSLNPCPPGKKAGVSVQKLPEPGEACETEGQSWKEDCNRCTCTGGSVSCTAKICTPLELPTNDGGPCTEGEEWIDECTNRCKCIQGEPRCTRRPCAAGSRPGVPVRFVVPAGDACDNEGEQWRDDCNTCRCDNGRVVCTKKACVGFERGGGAKKAGNCPFVPPGTLGFCINGCNGDDMCPDDEKCCSNGCGAMCMRPDSCLEGIVWKEECNTCECRNGEPACTKKMCAREQPQTDAPSAPAAPSAKIPDTATCLDGSVWMKDCNECHCVNSRELCTKKLCSSNVSPIDEVTGECREDSVWRRRCNRCRCIHGRAICSMKQCAPERPSPGNIDEQPGEGICRLPAVDLAKPTCEGYIRRWTYDFTRGECRRYMYGGCHGTQNLFRTRKRCRKRCGNDFSKRRPSSCHLPLDEGTCFDLIPRYFFNVAADKCKPFAYSGCGGNDNHYQNLAACIGACGGTYTSDDNECDRSRCPWSYYKHYTDKGCAPVYDSTGCCPVRFDCPETSSTRMCTYKGKKYAEGQPVAEASRLDPCKRDCRCSNSPERGLQIDCVEVNCPTDVWNMMSAGCLPLYLPDRCCPVSVKCPTRKRRSADDHADTGRHSPAHTCQAHGRTYVEGELMPTRGDPCTTCVCTSEYDGPHGPGCRHTSCLDFTGGWLERGCVPVYKSAVCCPVEWKCPEDVPTPSMRMPSTRPGDSHSRGVCSLPIKRGPCVKSLERYFFDTALQRCVMFVYGGCQANGNNFRTAADCAAACHSQASPSRSVGGHLVTPASAQAAVCLLPTVSGSCSDRLLRFGYDAASGECGSFVYSGCGGNANRFSSLEQCKTVCVPTASQDFCSLPAVTGRCRASVPRYFFNAEEGVCEEFLYGGCGGNANNFQSKEECHHKCDTGSRENKLQIQRGSQDSCVFGNKTVPRHGWMDVLDKCTVCQCLAPPKLTCHKLHCPQMPQGLDGLCWYRQRDPTACCPELVCDASTEVLPNLSPECGREQCHLPGVRPGCSVVYRPGECCPEFECLHPARQHGGEAPYQCDRERCPAACVAGHDQYGCVTCDCSDAPLSVATRAVPARRCRHEFCPRGCRSHYERGCIVCECDAPPTAPPAVRPPVQCPVVTCRPGCGHKRDSRGCTVCDCPPTTPRTTTPYPCVTVTCRPGCGYKQNSRGCTECDCPPTTPPTTTPYPCPTVTCRPGCGYKQSSRGCTVCDCPPTTPPTAIPYPCIVVTCRPGCGYKRNSQGCTVCDCPLTTLPTTTHCPTVTCRPGCGYMQDSRGCTVCDCPPTTRHTTPYQSTLRTTSPYPCVTVTCRPGCGYKQNSRGCTECDCPPTTPPTTTTYPCPVVTCRPGCEHTRDSRGCTMCYCPPGMSCGVVPDCPADCRLELRDGCPACDCASPVDLLLSESRRCPQLRCPPGCTLAEGGDGCGRCACELSSSASASAASAAPSCPCSCPAQAGAAPPPPPLTALSADCPPLHCPPSCDVSLDEVGCPTCSCAAAGLPGCARVSCPAGCRADTDPASGCPSCHCDLCPPCRCPDRCPTAVCPAHCRRVLRDGCYRCLCDDAFSTPSQFFSISLG